MKIKLRFEILFTLFPFLLPSSITLFVCWGQSRSSFSLSEHCRSRRRHYVLPWPWDWWWLKDLWIMAAAELGMAETFFVCLIYLCVYSPLVWLLSVYPAHWCILAHRYISPIFFSSIFRGGTCPPWPQRASVSVYI